jgi:hypothetical protein
MRSFQNEIFSAAEPTVRVLYATLLDETYSPMRLNVLDLIFLIAGPAFAGGSPVTARCRDAVAAGEWLLAAIALAEDEEERRGAREILSLLPSPAARLVLAATAQDDKRCP